MEQLEFAKWIPCPPRFMWVRESKVISFSLPLSPPLSFFSFFGEWGEGLCDGRWSEKGEKGGCAIRDMR